MSRLQPVTPDAATAEQLEVWNSIVATRGSADALTAADGGLMGPFNAMVSSPVVGRQIASLGAAVRRKSSLPENLLELAICTTGAHWRANFEWWAHRRLALQAGVGDDVLDCIERGESPRFADDAEAAVYGFASEMLSSGRVSDDAWSAARQHLEEQQVIDLVSTVGYYCLISCMLNAYQAPLPQGAEPVWPY